MKMLGLEAARRDAAKCTAAPRQYFGAVLAFESA
jgi:hypothetical protein